MAKRTIRQRIALDGGTQIKKELQEFGAAGEKAFKDLQAAIDRVDMKGLTGSLQQAQKAFVETGKSFQKFGRDMQGIGRSFSTYISLPIIAGFTASAKAAIDFESAMADVRKVVEFPTPEAFAQMGKDISDMSLRLPVAAEGLAAIAAAAGQAGIGADELTTFTELVAKASVAFELTADEAGSALAKIKTALNLTVPEVEQLTDAFNQLANNAATSEAEVLDVVLRVAPLGEMAGIAAKEIAAIGSAMVSMGVDSERAATGLRNILLRMQAGTRATKEQQEAWKRLGLDAVKVQRDIQKRGVGAILDVFERINQQAPEVRASIINALFGERVVDAAGPLIGNLQELRRQLGLVATDADFAGSTAREFGVRSETTANQIQLFVNNVSALRREFGEELVPLLKDALVGAQNVVTAFKELDPSTKRVIVQIGLLAASVGPLLIGFGLMISSIGTIIGGFGRLIGILATVNRSIGLLRAAIIGLPGIGILVAIGSELLTWAMNAGNATAAMEGHERIVDAVKAAYDKAGGAAKDWAKEIEKVTLLQATANLENVTRAAAEAREELQGLQRGTGVAQLQGEAREQAEALRDLAKAFIETGGNVDEFKKQVEAIGSVALAQPVEDYALALLNAADNLRDTEARVTQAKDVLTIFTGTANDAAEAMERLTGKEVAKPIEDLGKAADDAKGKVEALAGAITVTRHGASEPTTEAFNVVDGIAQAVEKAKEELDDLGAKTGETAEKVKAASEGIQLLVRSVPESMRTTDTAVDLAKTKLDELGTSAADAVEKIKAVASEAQTATQSAQAAIDPATAEAAKASIDGLVADLQRIAPAAQEAAASANAALSSIGDGDAAATAEAIVAPFRMIAGQIGQIFAEIRALVQSGFQGIASTVNQIAQQIQATINRILAALRAAAAAAARLRVQAASGAGGSGGGAPRVPGAPQFASGGGPLRGPGTATSDSIPIWASLGEFITQAKAVAYYGPELFHALNRMQLPKDFWKGMPGFNLGGLVSGLERSMASLAPAPLKLAGGGMALAPAASSGRTAIFNLGDGQSFTFLDPEEVAEKFARAVTTRSIRSTGRAPGWAGGRG